MPEIIKINSGFTLHFYVNTMFSNNTFSPYSTIYHIYAFVSLLSVGGFARFFGSNILNLTVKNVISCKKIKKSVM